MSVLKLGDDSLLLRCYLVKQGIPYADAIAMGDLEAETLMISFAKLDGWSLRGDGTWLQKTNVDHTGPVPVHVVFETDLGKGLN